MSPWFHDVFCLKWCFQPHLEHHSPWWFSHWKSHADSRWNFWHVREWNGSFRSWFFYPAVPWWRSLLLWCFHIFFKWGAVSTAPMNLFSQFKPLCKFPRFSHMGMGQRWGMDYGRISIYTHRRNCKSMVLNKWVGYTQAHSYQFDRSVEVGTVGGPCPRWRRLLRHPRVRRPLDRFRWCFKPPTVGMYCRAANLTHELKLETFRMLLKLIINSNLLFGLKLIVNWSTLWMVMEME